MTKLAESNFPTLFSAGGTEMRPVDRDLMTVLDAMSSNLRAILDGGISFTDNVDCVLVTATTHATPGTEFSTAHTLGKVPTGYIVYGQNAAGSVYDGTTTNTGALLYLKSDVSSKTFKLIIF